MKNGNKNEGEHVITFKRFKIKYTVKEKKRKESENKIFITYNQNNQKLKYNKNNIVLKLDKNDLNNMKIYINNFLKRYNKYINKIINENEYLKEILYYYTDIYNDCLGDDIHFQLYNHENNNFKSKILKNYYYFKDDKYHLYYGIYEIIFYILPLKLSFYIYFNADINEFIPLIKRISMELLSFVIGENEEGEETDNKVNEKYNLIYNMIINSLYYASEEYIMNKRRLLLKNKINEI